MHQQIITELQKDIVEFHQNNMALTQSEIAEVFGVKKDVVNEAIRLEAVQIAIAKQGYKEKDVKSISLIQRNHAL